MTSRKILPRLSLLLVLVAVIGYARTGCCEPPSGTGAASEDAAKSRKYPKPQRTGFLRLQRNEAGEAVSLQTSIVRYRSASGEGDLLVDLVGAVHIADPSYYNTLNKQFDQYDVVLYELVAPKGHERPERNRERSDNPLAMIQQIARTVLQLESQLDLIDYKKKNLVHADLSPEGMAKAMKERGENEFTLLLGITADVMRQFNREKLRAEEEGGGSASAFPSEGLGEDFDPLKFMLDPHAPVKLKRLMAEQFGKMKLEEGAGLGQTIDTILIKDRNQACMRVFQKELAAGKRKIAIFYGAAHMPDFERRLVTEFGLKKTGIHWLTAWDMEIRGNQLQQLFELFEE